MKAVEYKTTLDVFLDVVGGKWKALIIAKIACGPKRPSQLRKELPGINQRVLNAALRELSEDGIVQREIYPEIPPRTEYRLSEYGRTVLPLLHSMNEWGREHAANLISDGVCQTRLASDFQDAAENDAELIKRSRRMDYRSG